MKVLITTDGSPWSHGAIARAADLLPLGRMEVHVLSVAEMMPLLAASDLPMGAAALAFEQEAVSAHEDVRRAVEQLRGLGVEAIPHERDGDPAREIIALAEGLPADLIVVGAHGKNRLERLLLGSTSDAVLHRWHGACLVVRPGPEPRAEAA